MSPSGNSRPLSVAMVLSNYPEMSAWGWKELCLISIQYYCCNVNKTQLRQGEEMEESSERKIRFPIMTGSVACLMNPVVGKGREVKEFTFWIKD